MNFLLHRDVCAAFLRGDPRVGGQFIQNVGSLKLKEELKAYLRQEDILIVEWKVKTL